MVTRRQFISLAGLSVLAGCSRDESTSQTEPQVVPTGSAPTDDEDTVPTPTSTTAGMGGATSLRAGDYEAVKLGTGNSRVKFNIDASHPVDFFLYTSERFAAYEYAVDHGIYPMPPTEYKDYGTTISGDVELESETEYVCVMDNSRFENEASIPQSKTRSQISVKYTLTLHKPSDS